MATSTGRIMQLLSSKSHAKATRACENTVVDAMEAAPVSQPKKELDLANVISNCLPQTKKKGNIPGQ